MKCLNTVNVEYSLNTVITVFKLWVAIKTFVANEIFSGANQLAKIKVRSKVKG